MMKKNFDLIVIGAGHAGLEAAWIADQMSLRVGLITLKEAGIASAPCNPAIGGVGKGQVVREVDALGGLMGRLADLAAIQYRTLNESKGYAVRSTRVQIDKDLYSQNAEKILKSETNVELIYGRVIDISAKEQGFTIDLEKGEEFSSEKLIVTGGTFLNGKLHCGEEQLSGGRRDCAASPGLVELLKSVPKLPYRFKTGTPARLVKDSIDFSALTPQPSDPHSVNFHSLHKRNERYCEQVSCYLTRTTEETIALIQENLARSPLFNGQIKGIGPRYCPSIEDKVHRYPDRKKHHVFVEPEGLTNDTVYPNGLSTSLPKDVQEAFIRSIPGLEKAEIRHYGHSVEYDVVDTCELDRTLEHSKVSGLYFAGQVNGTSGYEEAAGQGIIAGINASLALLGKEKLILSRDHSYIGVMVEDLVSNQRDEPYRLFTARCEKRLQTREDNVIQRMRRYRAHLGLNTSLDCYQEEFLTGVEELLNFCRKTLYSFDSANKEHFKDNSLGPFVGPISLATLLKRSQLAPIETLKNELAYLGQEVPTEDIVSTVAITIRYEDYIAKNQIELDRLQRLDQKSVVWSTICEMPSISNECRQRIEKVRPETFWQLKNIEGIRPATVAMVAAQL